MIKAAIHKTFRLFGFDIVQFPPRDQASPPDFREDELEILRQVRRWTMVSPDRIYALIQAVRYVRANEIPGAIVECGVWKGGSCWIQGAWMCRCRPTHLLSPFPL